MISRLVQARLQKSKQSVLLLGPRQTGKSTLLNGLSPDLTVNLMDEELFLRYSKEPARLKREVHALQKPSVILLDEIQRVPALLNMVQLLLDEKKQHRFLLTGSSARKLKRGGANLLPGRIILEHLDPLTFWELGKDFDLERVLQIGSLPGVYLDREAGSDILNTYAAVYLREEIQAEASTKNIGGYARFLDVAAEASGQWINYSKVATDCEIPKETVRRFFQVLEDTLLVHRISAFHAKRSKRRISQRDRFIFFDLGVRNTLLGLHQSTVSSQEKGPLFEQWLLLQCLSYSRANHKNWKLSSYRTEAGAEVDFILDNGKCYFAIECKYGKNISESDTKGLRSFEEIADKKVEKFLVYRGERKEKFSQGELALPYQVFLNEYLPEM